MGKGWLIYCLDQYDHLQVLGVYTNENIARSVIREHPYKSNDDLTIQIKYKIMEVIICNADDDDGDY